ncbi:MAG: glycosyl transferase [Pseudanabaena frigida]|uniref:Glycosyl transferase n=1 Tax=Pseudanabaena frigida TaxID=945775 RepID=A0A2W4W8G2_9CYAN|nr:MAG: glycosyl transferase [Pseudanabaena frigida]
MEIKISLITICKNSEATLERTLQSVISQSYKNIEYIVIDGNSSDKTKEIIEKYRDSIHYYISEPDRNSSDALNKGIRVATGDYISFVNSDDYLVDSNVVKDVVEAINSNRNCLIFYGDVEIRPNPKLSNDITIFKPPSPDDLLDNITLNIDPFLGASYYSSKVFATVGYFNISTVYANDLEWFLKVFAYWEAKYFYYIPRTIFSYSMCGESSRDIEVTLKAAYEFIDNAPMFQTEYWLKRRIRNMQQKIIYLEKFCQDTQELSMNRLIIIQEVTKQVQFTTIFKNFLREKFFVPFRYLLNRVYRRDFK